MGLETLSHPFREVGSISRNRSPVTMDGAKDLPAVVLL